MLIGNRPFDTPAEFCERAKLVLAIELRRTHGWQFAVAFVQAYAREIDRATESLQEWANVD